MAKKKRTYADYALTIIAPQINHFRFAREHGLTDKDAIEGLNRHHDLESSITDMLSDLRHVCDRFGYSFAELDGNAYSQYLRDKNEPWPEEMDE
jgi:hypothetical protein